MPFNRLLELFMLLLRLGMGQHIEVGVVVREYTEAKANTVKTRAHRFPPSQSLSVIHILLYFCFSHLLFFCLHVNEAILPIAF